MIIVSMKEMFQKYKFAPYYPFITLFSFAMQMHADTDCTNVWIRNVAV